MLVFVEDVPVSGRVDAGYRAVGVEVALCSH